MRISGHYYTDVDYVSSELNYITMLLAQSAELRLKAMIAEASPYLLFLTTSWRPPRQQEDTPFSRYPTMDATHLPYAANVICNKNLSADAIQRFEQVRIARNSVAHLGATETVVELHEVADLMMAQYVDLWGAGWLAKRLLHEIEVCHAMFDDDENHPPQLTVLSELPYIYSVITDSYFEDIIGHSVTEKRYLCHACYSAVNARDFLAPEDCLTAFVDAAANSLCCRLCEKQFKVVSRGCGRNGCDGDFVSDNGDEFAGRCHRCGQPTETIENG